MPPRSRLTLPSLTLKYGLAALLVVQGVVALGVTDRLRQDNERAVNRVTALGEEVVLANGQQLARLDWRGWPHRCWVGVPGAQALREAVVALRRAGVTHVAYAGFTAEQVSRAGLHAKADPRGHLIGRATIPPRGEQQFVGCP